MGASIAFNRPAAGPDSRSGTNLGATRPWHRRPSPPRLTERDTPSTSPDGAERPTGRGSCGRCTDRRRGTQAATRPTGLHHGRLDYLRWRRDAPECVDQDVADHESWIERRTAATAQPPPAAPSVPATDGANALAPAAPPAPPSVQVDNAPSTAATAAPSTSRIEPPTGGLSWYESPGRHPRHLRSPAPDRRGPGGGHHRASTPATSNPESAGPRRDLPVRRPAYVRHDAGHATGSTASRRRGTADRWQPLG